jgi:hypothetical protein
VDRIEGCHEERCGKVVKLKQERGREGVRGRERDQLGLGLGLMSLGWVETFRKGERANARTGERYEGSKEKVPYGPAVHQSLRSGLWAAREGGRQVQSGSGRERKAWDGEKITCRVQK